MREREREKRRTLTQVMNTGHEHGTLIQDSKTGHWYRTSTQGITQDMNTGPYHRTAKQEINIGHYHETVTQLSKIGH